MDVLVWLLAAAAVVWLFLSSLLEGLSDSSLPDRKTLARGYCAIVLALDQDQQGVACDLVAKLIATHRCIHILIVTTTLLPRFQQSSRVKQVLLDEHNTVSQIISTSASRLNYDAAFCVYRPNKATTAIRSTILEFLQSCQQNYMRAGIVICPWLPSSLALSVLDHLGLSSGTKQIGKMGAGFRTVSVLCPRVLLPRLPFMEYVAQFISKLLPSPSPESDSTYANYLPTTPDQVASAAVHLAEHAIATIQMQKETKVSGTHNSNLFILDPILISRWSQSIEPPEDASQPSLL